MYHYINCQQFIGKTADSIHDQLKLVYRECAWYDENASSSLVVLDNLDLLIEPKTATLDPSQMLYYALLVECTQQVILCCIRQFLHLGILLTVCLYSDQRCAQLCVE